MSDLDAELMSARHTGLEAEKFLNTRLGQYMVNRAKEEIETARAGLEEVSPQNKDKIQELQNDIRLARKFTNWLGHAIQEGHMAEQQLQEDQLED